MLPVEPTKELEMTAPTTDIEARRHTTEDLEAELEQVREELREQSARRGTTQLAALFAVLLALAALLAVAFKLQDDNNSAVSMHNRMTGSGVNGGTATGGTPSTMMGGVGASKGATDATGTGTTAGAVHAVSATLGEFWIRPDVSSVPAGKVRFVARNVGKVPHELMVERMPMKMDGPGQPNEDAAQGMIEDLDPGQSGQMTLNLTPGMYMLFCNLPGHYAAGQHTMFRVTG
jgi:uncharacterized cupredoxin-like copper-binding protein